MKTFISFIGSAVCLLFLNYTIAFASLDGQIVADPEFPNAYDTVTLTLKSYSFDPTLSLNTWKVDGVVVASGLGVTSTKVNAKGTGSITAVEVKAVTANGSSIVLTYNLAPESVDLMWESVESYTPPFYEGLPLPGEGALVKVVAFPSFVERGRGVSVSDISYTWTINDQVMQSLSGTGKQSITTRLDLLSDSTVVKVSAQSPGGSHAESSVTIYPKAIDPVFYFYDPILGPDYANAVNRRLEMTKETSLKLEPYFISKVAGEDTGEKYDWYLDGISINTQTPTLITLKPKDKSAGVKALSVEIANTKRRLQQAVAKLEVVFDSR